MTYVEFFDVDLIENICSAITHAPDRIILVGDSRKQLAIHAERYKKILADRGSTVDVDFRSVNKNNMSSVLELLTKIVNEYDDCVFDLTGGDETFLVAAGIIFEHYRDEKNIQMHWFNINSNHVQDCDLDGKTIMEEPLPEISIDENVRIYGGRIVYDDEKPNGTHRWDLNGDFMQDIDIMWKICSRNPYHWNGQIAMLRAAVEVSHSDELYIEVRRKSFDNYVENENIKFGYYPSIISELIKSDLIHSFNFDNSSVTVKFKNEQIRRVLTTAGLSLELKILKTALSCREKDGDKVYNDVMNGVFIDWDGDVNVGSGDIENEVDLVMMHGMIPVFVSCKNGYFTNEELYKFNTVAKRFGGSYAMRILVASNLSGFNPQVAENICSRAEDMGIRVVEPCDLSDDELSRIVSSFYKKAIKGTA